MLPYLVRLYTYKSLAATFTRMIAADLWRLSTLAFMLILEMVVYIIQGPGRALMFTSIDVMRYGVKALFHHDLRSSLGLNAVSRTDYLDGPATGSCIAANPPCPGKVALGIRLLRRQASSPTGPRFVPHYDDTLCFRKGLRLQDRIVATEYR